MVLMVLFEGNNEVCSAIGGPRAPDLLAGNSLQRRLATLYPTLVEKEKFIAGPTPAGSAARRATI